MRIFIVMGTYDGGETVCDGVFRNPEDASDCLGVEWSRRDNAYQGGRPGVYEGRHRGRDGNENETSFTFKDGLFVGFRCGYGFNGRIEEKELA